MAVFSISRVIFLLCSFVPMRWFAQDAPDLQTKLDVHARLAQQYLSEQQPELAMSEFRSILALDPNNVSAHGSLGLLLYLRGNCREAAPQFRAALAVQRNLWNVEALLGICEQRMGEQSEGRADLESAFPYLLQERIRSEAGKELLAIYSSTGELDKAEAIKHKLANTEGSGGSQNQAGKAAEGEGGAHRPGYVGDRACFSCHQGESVSYRRTAHHLTSRPAGRDSILGAFHNGSDLLTIRAPGGAGAPPGLFFRMEEKDGSTYETAVMGSASQKQTQRERIDIVIGSGERGQSYLYWDDSALYQLPVSYWSDGRQWINSPGYIDGTAEFSRPIHPRCLECHVTYIRSLFDGPRVNKYDRTSLVMGISCEACHGPGAEHINKMKLGSRKGSVARAIVNPAALSRDRQVELCALCHNGIRSTELKPAFSYQPGQPLDQYVKAEPIDPSQRPDVHGNQVGLLQRSRCYLASPTMTCSTCHDVHEPERAAASYSTKCLGCHDWRSCGLAKTKGRDIVRDCIGCHMPKEPTNAILSQTAGKEVRATMRNHWIKVYPDIQN